MKSGHIVISKGGRGNQKFMLEHRIVAERAIGKSLPPGSEIHHWDENPANNDPSNLVICPDKAYHKLLHVRMDAYKATGDPDKRKCPFCKKYDDPDLMMTGSSMGKYEYRYHRACRQTYQRANKDRRNASQRVWRAAQREKGL